MILVDTSVVIDDIRGKDAKLQGLIGSLPVAICGIVRAEVFCGADRDRKRDAPLPERRPGDAISGAVHNQIYALLL